MLPVGVVFVDGAEFPVEIDLDLEVEIPDVPLVGLHGEDSGHLVSLLAGEVVVQVEHGLLPVGVPAGEKSRNEQANVLV